MRVRSVMPGGPSTPDPCDLRIQRLEESLGFAQHDNEQLAAEVLALGKRVLELARRLEALEQRMREASAAKSPEEPDTEPPIE